MISDKKVRELRQIILEDYGLELSSDQSFEVAKQLTELFEVLIYGKEESSGETPKQDRDQKRTPSCEIGG
jgi:hypothetical protein